MFDDDLEIGDPPFADENHNRSYCIRREGSISLTLSLENFVEERRRCCIPASEVRSFDRFPVRLG